MNFSNFQREWKKAAKFFEGESEKVTRGTAIRIFSQIIKQSPVKTGRFRSNWQTTLGKPAQGTVPGADLQASAAISQMTGTAKGYKVGQTLFMTNNLPYAYALSQGSSKQRPRGWITAIIMSFQKTVDDEARKRK